MIDSKHSFFTAFTATVEKSYHMHSENMILGQRKIGEHHAKCRVLGVGDTP